MDITEAEVNLSIFPLLKCYKTVLKIYYLLFLRTVTVTRINAVKTNQAPFETNGEIMSLQT